jgi:hypothetical protein
VGVVDDLAPGFTGFSGGCKPPYIDDIVIGGVLLRTARPWTAASPSANALTEGSVTWTWPYAACA